jgi:DNA-binding Lrp family transcriptional regulator
VAFDLPLTREAMADYLGLTLETVSRQMSGLKKDGVIRWRASATHRERRVGTVGHVHLPALVTVERAVFAEQLPGRAGALDIGRLVVLRNGGEETGYVGHGALPVCVDTLYGRHTLIST